ncbi:Necrosis inducing protein [Phytophthora cactorum]|nr:Necrosis inducing protein [Phytophthora cactorum]
MNLRAFLITIVAALAATDVVASITTKSKAAIKFKPQLHITNGCHPYPAVNAAGETSGGLATQGAPSAACKGSGWGSQVYGRSTWYKGRWAIMYSWYFPKDSPSTGLGHRHDWEHVIVWINNPDVANPKILARILQVRSPKAGTVAGNTAKINYESHWPVNHALDSTDKGGETQPLIMWDQMTEAARRSLNTVGFGNANVPMNDGNFMRKIANASPW